MSEIKLSKSDIKDYIEERISKGQSSNPPIAIIMVGGPGSGKSTAQALVLQQLNKKMTDFINIDPDQILKDKYGNINTPENRAAVEKINDMLYTETFAKTCNLIFDGTGKDFDWYNANVIKKLKNEGYTTYLCIIMMHDIKTAKERIASRKEQTNRDVPDWYVDQTYESLDEIIDNYLNIPCTELDNLFLYDNTSDTIRLEMRSSCTEDKNKIFSVHPLKQGGKTRSKSRSKSKSKSRSKSRSKSKSKSKNKSKNLKK
jgi:predicted ABC-type ATPase